MVFLAFRGGRVQTVQPVGPNDAFANAHRRLGLSMRRTVGKTAQRAVLGPDDDSSLVPTNR